ncbi:Fis family transcriptional regulator [Planosporangium thailandense]|uniref:Sensor-like histidine kinase SenX3 n=1 Tax=Planosporangium thailandense TaxID=765197 RepID=A0ABX0Y121_9ACTN|nr:Fis family transcriptional regulator [Planosporangium thailandense]
MEDQQTARLRRWWRSARAYAVLTAVVGVSGSLAGAAALAGADREAGRQATSRRVELARRAVTDELQRYLDTVRLVAGAAGTQPALSRDAYLELTQPLVDAKLVGATDVAYVVPATDEQVAAAQRQWRTRGVPDLQLHPVGSAREHFFTVFDRPLDGAGPPVTGEDLSQSAEPAAALDESRRGGVATLSRPYVPLRDRGLPANRRQLSFTLAAPVLRPSDAGGAGPFVGWILIELRAPALLGTILRGSPDQADGLRAAALYATDADGHEVRVAGLSRGPAGRSDVRQDVDMPVARRIWTLRATVASPGAGGAPLWVAGGGSLLTVVLAVLVAALVTVRDRARSHVLRTTGQLEADLARRKLVEAQLHHANQALAEQQNYFAALLDSLDIVVVACDNDGEVTLKNAYARRLGGPATLTHLDGTPLRDDELPLERALRAGRVDGVEVLYQGSDQWPRTMIVHGQALSATDGSRIGAVMTGYDITELRDHERELTGFAAIAAHDLKAPLAVIAAYTELLAADSTGEAAELLERINAGVGRMRALIDDLLAYASARDAVLDSVTVDLREVVADVVTARTDHLRLTPDERFPDIYVGPLPAVYADEAMVRQLVDNLVGNALKYVPPGKAARVDITGTEDDGWVRVEIADRGIGIPAAERAAVFTPFHRVQTDHAYGGTGLGLAICQRIVDRHGGQIGVTANLGGGSRFFFTLPAAIKSPDRPVAARVSAPGQLPSAA